MGGTPDLARRLTPLRHASTIRAPMGEVRHFSRRLAWVIGLIACLTILSCDRLKSASSGKGRRVASLSPAATDLLVGMGAKDRLVAVSNFEFAPDVKSLPHVGDYQTT